jgi:hypothetical protein
MSKLVGYAVLLYIVAELFSPEPSRISLGWTIFGTCLGFILIHLGELESFLRSRRDPTPRQ